MSLGSLLWSADVGKIIVLVVSILMPPGVPDINHAVRVDSFESCWDAAKDYIAHDVTEEMRSRGAIGLSAGCAYQSAPSQKN